MRCASCGNLVDDGKSFCPACGMSMGKAAQRALAYVNERSHMQGMHDGIADAIPGTPQAAPAKGGAGSAPAGARAVKQRSASGRGAAKPASGKSPAAAPAASRVTSATSTARRAQPLGEPATGFSVTVPGAKPRNDDLTLDGILDTAKEELKKIRLGGRDADGNPRNAPATASGANSHMLIGFLAIFLGAFGVHKFCLGYTREGCIMLVCWLLGVMLAPLGIGVMMLTILYVIALIEGVMYISKPQAEFMRTYVQGRHPWF